MAVLPLGTSDWVSSSQNINRFRLRNMYLVENPASVDGVSRLSRPTLSLEEDFGIEDRSVDGIWTQDGVFDNTLLVLIESTLYRYQPKTGITTVISTAVAGSGVAEFATDGIDVLFTRDNGILYRTDGETLSVVNIPDNRKVSSVDSINGYFLLTIKDSQRFYWIAPDETEPDAFSFASAERTPDNLVCVRVLGDEIWFLGTRGSEVWSPADDVDDPFQRITGRVYSDGCADKKTAIKASVGPAPALIWVTDSRSVVVTQGNPTRVSKGTQEELLRGATNLRGWFFKNLRNDFYVLTSDDFTLVFDTTRGDWLRWDSYDHDFWRAHLGTQTEDRVYAGDAETGQIWQLEEGYSDEGEPVVREISGYLPLTGRREPCNSLFMFVNSGWSPEYGYEPILQMRFSDDLGATWTDYFEASLGDKGEYHYDVFYRSLGQMQSPGRVFELRFSAPASFRIDHAIINEE